MLRVTIILNKNSSELQNRSELSAKIKLNVKGIISLLMQNEKIGRALSLLNLRIKWIAIFLLDTKSLFFTVIIMPQGWQREPNSTQYKRRHQIQIYHMRESEED